MPKRYDDDTPQATGAEVPPQSYTAGGSTMTVNFENTGSQGGDMYEYMYWLGLDAAGDPVVWSLGNDNLTPAPGVLDAGETGSTTAP